MPVSHRNPEIARLRELTRHRRARRDAGRFVVEGPKLVAEALGSALAVHRVVVVDGWSPPEDLAAALDASGLQPMVVAEHTLERIASTRSPQPVLAEVELVAASAVARSTTAALVAVDVNDPGNLGTMIRSATAAGFDLVLAAGNTVDPWSPKAVRASAGTVLRTPVWVGTTADAFAGLGAAGVTTIGTTMTGAPPCTEVDVDRPVAFVMGNEAHGLGAEAGGLVDEWTTIPMTGPAESLNVAMAATILTWEVARRRGGSTAIAGST